MTKEIRIDTSTEIYCHERKEKITVQNGPFNQILLIDKNGGIITSLSWGDMDRIVKVFQYALV